jgi:hypothetical protein
MKAGDFNRKRSFLEWGILPQTPWDLALIRQDLLDSATARCARSRRIPATESTLGLRPRRALSFAQMQSV